MPSLLLIALASLPRCPQISASTQFGCKMHLQAKGGSPWYIFRSRVFCDWPPCLVYEKARLTHVYRLAEWKSLLAGQCQYVTVNNSCCNAGLQYMAQLLPHFSMVVCLQACVHRVMQGACLQCSGNTRQTRTGSVTPDISIGVRLVALNLHVGMPSRFCASDGEQAISLLAGQCHLWPVSRHLLCPWSTIQGHSQSGMTMLGRKAEDHLEVCIEGMHDMVTFDSSTRLGAALLLCIGMRLCLPLSAQETPCNKLQIALTVSQQLGAWCLWGRAGEA